MVKGVYDRRQQMAFFYALQPRSASLALLWLVGCSTGYRVSDLLKMTPMDVANGRAVIIESKTGKFRAMKLPPRVTEAVHVHILTNELDPMDPLFFGRDRAASVTRQHAHRVFREIGLQLGLDAIGTHSMRKTFAWNVLLATKSFSVVQDALNHAYLSTTFLYLIDGLTAALPKPGRLGIPPSSIIAVASPT